MMMTKKISKEEKEKKLLFQICEVQGLDPEEFSETHKKPMWVVVNEEFKAACAAAKEIVDEDDDFGYTLQEMDTEAFYNIREWVSEAINKHGGRVTGRGIGCGQAEIEFKVCGAPFYLSIKPCMIPKEK